jgi:Tol biopolymer transport system component/DNA-binding winged helix-turn-helix (wHTH) protein
MSLNEVHHRVRFGPYEADLQTLELWKHGIRIKLSGQPFQILKVLLANPGKLISRDELRTQLWPEDTFVDFNHGLNAAMNKLRDALTDSADDPKYIETLPRRGYRFIGQVEPVQVAARAPVRETVAPKPVIAESQVLAAAPVEIVSESSPPTVDVGPPPTVRRFWLRPAIIAVAALMVVLVGATVVGIVHWFRQAVLTPAETKAATLVSGQDSVVDPAFSSDGNRIAFIRRGRTPGTAGLFIKDVGTDNVVQLTRTPGDCCPAWSPDGTLIAFARRGSDQQFQLYMLSTTPGATEHQLGLGDVVLRSGETSWTADGKALAFSGLSRTGSGSIYLLSLDNMEIRQISNAPGDAEDWGPAFSPDGEKLAFVRRSGEGPETVRVSAANGQNSRIVSSEPGRIVGPPAWTSDGQSVVYALTGEGNPSLRKVSANGGGSTTIAAAGENAWHPSTSRRGYRLAFQQVISGSSIAALNLSNENSLQTQAVVTSSKGRNEGPQLSPDGKKMVFMSDRSGTMEISLSNADGTNPLQLTALGNAGTPRWSPDGKLIAFDSVVDGRSAIYVVPTEGGEPRLLFRDDSNNMVPSFSRDGKWVYFGSDRGGAWQVWKIPVSNGTPVQVTKSGGFAAMEAGEYIYYAKNRYPGPEIWRMPVVGGMEQRLLPRVVPRTWASWAVTDHGIVYMEDSLQGGYPLRFYDFNTQQSRNLAALPQPAFWLAASRDGKTVWTDQANQEQSTIMMLENFH